MTPEDLTADLSAHLRHKGVDFRLADLDAFVTGLRDDSFDMHHVGTLVERFIVANQAHAQQARALRRAREALRNGLYLLAMTAVPGALLLGISALGASRPPPPDVAPQFWTIFVMLAISTAAPAIAGAIRTARAWATLRRLCHRCAG